MIRKKLATLLLAIALLLPGLGAVGMNGGSLSQNDGQGPIEPLVGDVPVGLGPGTPLPGFTANSGQFHDPEVHYYADLPTGGIAFKTGGMLMNLEVPTDPQVPPRDLGASPGDAPSFGLFQELRYNQVSGCTIELTFEGGRDASPVGIDPFPGVYNYIYGNGPDGNAKGVRTYSQVVYEDLYDGIDLVYRMTPQGLKYEFIVAPGADPSVISVRVSGHDALFVDDGDLVIGTSVDDIRDSGLDVFYQDSPHEKVRAIFDVRGPAMFGFMIGDRDADRTLVIDPLVFSTFLATSEFEEGYSVVVDGDGNPVVAGITNDGSFPTTTGAYQENHSHIFDVFITKLDADGSTLIFSTFLGSTGGESVSDIFLDDSGNIYVGGNTNSGNFPTTTDAFQTSITGYSDAFVSKLSPDGSRLLASTLLGGFWDDGVESITADTEGNMYIAGTTMSGDFPVTAGAANTSGVGYNGFVCKVNSAATDLVYSTYLGGSEQDAAFSILLNDDGSVYVAGSTQSDDFPISANAYQKGRQRALVTAFVTRVASDGSSFEASTFLGGTWAQEAHAVDMDAYGEVHVVGTTNSDDFPVTEGAFQTTIGSSDDDIFVTRMDADLTEINTSTFIGGDTNDRANDASLDPEGNIVICGSTQSLDYPTTNGSAQRVKSGFDDAFVTKLSWNYTTLEYSSFLGGGDGDGGHGVAASGTLFAYVTGETFSHDFPTTGGAYNTSFGGKRDAFLTRITLDLDPPIAVAGPDVIIDQHESVTFNGSSSADNIGIANWTWSLSYGGEDVKLFGPVVSWLFDDAGLYPITLQVKDTSNHKAVDTLDVTVRDITAPVADAGLSKTVAQGATVEFDGSGSSDNVGIVMWNWSFTYGDGPVVLSGEVTSFVFEDAGDYNVTLAVRDAVGHIATDHIMVHVEDTTPPVADAGDDIFVDQHEEVELNGSGSRDDVGIVRWTWSFIYAGVPDELRGEVVLFTFGIPGTYEMILRVEDGSGYYALDTMNVVVRDSTPPTVRPGPDQEVDQGATVILDATASEDNVGIVTYAWNFEYGGATVTLEDARSTFLFDLAGVYTATLTLIDAAGNSASGALNVTVRDIVAPTAVAGEDLTIDQGDDASLDGSLSTDNVGIVTFTWSFEYDGSTKTLDGVAPAFFFEEVGEFIVRLTVEDGAGLIATDELVVTVLDTMVPVPDPGADRSVDQGAAAQLDGSASSDNVGIVRYSWTFVYDLQEVTLEGVVASYTFNIPGIYDITLKVWDAANNSSPATFTLTVLDIESPIAAIEVGNTVIKKGETAGWTATGSVDNVGIVKYTWTYKEDGKTVTLEGFSVGPRFDEVGDHEVTLTVEDAAGNIGQETFTITVESNAWMWAVLAIICVGIVLAILFVMQRRAKVWPDVEEGPEV